MMLTVYVSPEGWVDRTAKAPLKGTGEAAGEPVGEAPGDAVDDGVAVARGEVEGDVTAFAVGDALACKPGPPQPAVSMATASSDVESFTADTVFQRQHTHGVTFPVRSCI
jgi:hypothetical protein